jgi:eukaryotic-like serine/threonine-protein kinase
VRAVTHPGLEGALLDGRYRLGPELGRGGMSVVYAADDLRLTRVVAVKVMQGVSSSTQIERLFREARAAARADHPAIVTVFGYGTDAASGLEYLVLERLRGSDLATRIAEQGPLPVALVIRIGSEVADALAAVHQTGVVHRDLKPANIFLSRRGMRVDEVKLLDFGTAKQLDLQTLTDEGEVLGTLAYMPPEQMRDSLRIDARVDIYALGVSLYQCLAARLPFEGPTAAALAANVLRGEVALPLAEARPDAPRALVEIIERCMRRKASERFQSAREVCDALLACAP